MEIKKIYYTPTFIKNWKKLPQNIKKKAVRRFARRPDCCRVPAYPTTAPKTVSVQHALAIALTRPSRNASGNAAGLSPALLNAVFIHSDAD